MNLVLSLLLLAPGGEPVFTAHSAGEARPRGPLLKLEADWSATLGGDKPVRIAGDELIDLRQEGVVLPPLPPGPHVRFANGDVLAGLADSLADDRLRFTASLGARPELTVPLTILSAIWISPPASADQARAIHRQLAEPRNRDTVWLKNGDVLDGTVLRLGSAVLMIDVGGKPVKVERDKLAVVGFNTELARLDRPRQPFARLTLRDGSRLSLSSAAFADKVLTGKASFGASLAVPLEAIVRIEVRQGRSVPLAELKPAAYDETPYFAGSRWLYRLDQSVAGNPLRLGGHTHDQGIGMHSASRLTYALEGKFRRFESQVGLDDLTGQRGRARVQVLVDGKPQDLGWSGDLKGGEAPRLVRASVAGAKELTLVVEFGADGLDVQDHVNWADARLIR